ncbi:MAG: type II toxin-antitoxin system HicB family antitoxin [Lachnospiraceae bacterium]
MAKYAHPAIFTPEEDGGFSVDFPDLDICYTCGDNMEDAYEMAVDALGLCISDMEKESIPLPPASAPASIKTDSDSVLLIVEFDMAAYKRKHNSKARAGNRYTP